VVCPEGPTLQEHVRRAGFVHGAQQETGGTVAAPMLVAGGAADPAVAIKEPPTHRSSVL
jgi:hypothetical protein